MTYTTKYRILKRHRRSDRYGEIQFEYVIQEFVPKSFLNKERWEDFTVQRYGRRGYGWQQEITFTDHEQACEYLKYLHTPTPEDEVVTCPASV